MADDKQKILVVCSFSDQEEKFKAPAGFQMEQASLVLNNYEHPALGTLKPFETRVYLWKS
jgi:hypothetical protein